MRGRGYSAAPVIALRRTIRMPGRGARVAVQVGTEPIHRTADRGVPDALSLTSFCAVGIIAAQPPGYPRHELTPFGATSPGSTVRRSTLHVQTAETGEHVQEPRSSADAEPGQPPKPCPRSWWSSVRRRPCAPALPADGLRPGRGGLATRCRSGGTWRPEDVVAIRSRPGWPRPGKGPARMGDAGTVVGWLGECPAPSWWGGRPS